MNLAIKMVRLFLICWATAARHHSASDLGSVSRSVGSIRSYSDNYRHTDGQHSFKYAALYSEIINLNISIYLIYKLVASSLRLKLAYILWQCAV